MQKIFKYTAALLLLLPFTAHAADIAPNADAAKAGTASIYHPDACEFAITFPEKPYISRRCDPEDPKRCYDLTSYTKVFEMSSTVNFRVTCNVLDEKMQKNYTPDVMKATLRAMTARSTVQTFDTTYREAADYKQAGLVGQGQSGTLSTIYIAQLWMGKHSALSVEAELIGDAQDQADTLFSDILKSVHFVKADTTKPDPKPETDLKK